MNKIWKKIIIGLLIFIGINIGLLLIFKAKVLIFYATVQVYVEYYIKDYGNINQLFEEKGSCFYQDGEKACGYTDYNHKILFFYYKHYLYNSKGCDIQLFEEQDRSNDLVKIIPLGKNTYVLLYTLG